MVNKNITSWLQLEQVLLQIIVDCMNEVAQKVVQLLKDNVDKHVYDVGTAMGREYYYAGSKRPTGQLRDSVVKSDPEVKGNVIESKVYHDADLMDYEPETYLHGSNYYSPSDVRELLPLFINEGLTGGLFGEKWAGLKRAYMSITKEELKDGLLDQWMVEALRKRGIQASIGIGVS
jgi:hypothetical protein